MHGNDHKMGIAVRIENFLRTLKKRVTSPSPTVWILRQCAVSLKRNAADASREGQVHPARLQLRGGYQVFVRAVSVADLLSFHSACAFSEHCGQIPWVKSAPV